MHKESIDSRIIFAGQEKMRPLFGDAFFILELDSSIHSAHTAVSGHSGSGVLFLLFENERFRCENC